MDRVAFETARLELARLRVATGREAALQTALRLSARTLRVERVGYWAFSDDATTLESRQQYTLSTDEYGAGVVLPESRYPHYWAALREKRVVAVTDALVDPMTSELAGTYLRPLGIGAMMDAPVFQAGELIGVVCHEHVGPARVWSGDEIAFAGAVADLISMTLEQSDRIAAEDQLRRYLGTVIAAEKLAVMQSLSRAISHDFANLFAVVELAAGALTNGARSPGRIEELTSSLHSVAAIGGDLVGQLRRFGHPPAPTAPRSPLRHVIERVVPVLGTLTREVATVELELELGDDDIAALPTDELEQIVLNLILNARDAIEVEGHIRVGARRDGAFLVIEVVDDGVGMAPGVLARIWEPYFTTKATGTGLGMITVRTLVDDAGGAVEVDSAPGKGTRFAVRLPAL